MEKQMIDRIDKEARLQDVSRAHVIRFCCKKFLRTGVAHRNGKGSK